MHDAAPRAAADLPRVAPDAELVPHDRLEGAPHAVVDGPRLPGTILALSHRPGSGTPAGLADDTSALIVDRYLRAEPAGPELRAVTNDHYDEDGLFALWLLLHRPPEGSPERALAIAAAEAGDFGTWTDPWAPRVAIAAMAMAEAGTTPLPAVQRALRRAGGRDPAGELYRAVLPRVGRLLADPERHRRLWEPAWRRVAADMALIDSGEARITEVDAADVAIVETPRPLHDMAVHPRTDRMRVLTRTPDGVVVLRHRYETWVDYVSRPLAPRVDLAPVLPRLRAIETRPGVWRFDGLEAVRPRLLLAGPGGRPAPTGIAPERIVHEVAEVVAGGARA